MKKEKTLSDCLRCNGGTNKEHIRDIREFVKKLKEEIEKRYWFCNYDMIDKLVGEDLK